MAVSLAMLLSGPSTDANKDGNASDRQTAPYKGRIVASINARPRGLASGGSAG